MTPPTPYHLFIHTATVKVPVISESSIYLIDTVSGSYTNTSNIPCRVQENSGTSSIGQQRLVGQVAAVGMFPPDTTLTKDSRIVITGDGFPSGGKTFKVMSPTQNVAGAGTLVLVDLEYEA